MWAPPAPRFAPQHSPRAPPAPHCPTVRWGFAVPGTVCPQSLSLGVSPEISVLPYASYFLPPDPSSAAPRTTRVHRPGRASSGCPQVPFVPRSPCSLPVSAPQAGTSSHQVLPPSCWCHLAGVSVPKAMQVTVGHIPPSSHSSWRGNTRRWPVGTLDSPLSPLPPVTPLWQRHRPLAEAPAAAERGGRGLEAALRLHPGRRLPELRPAVALGPHFPLHQVTTHACPRTGGLEPLGVHTGTRRCVSLCPSLQTLVRLRPGVVLPQSQPCHQPGLGSWGAAAALGIPCRHGHAGESKGVAWVPVSSLSLV